MNWTRPWATIRSASASEADRLTVQRSLSVMIGSAARRYAVWEAIDPQELIVGGDL